MRKLLLFIGLSALAILPIESAHASIVQCEGSLGLYGCKACDVAQLARSLIQFFIMISVLIATILFAYAGFKFVTSAGNQSTIKKAKGMFVDIFIGIVLVLGAWLIVDLFIMSLVNPGTFSDIGGAWNKIKCEDNAAIRDLGITPINTTGGAQAGAGGTTPAGGGAVLAAGSVSTLAEAAQAAFDSKMSTAAGPDGGNLACVWAVNRMMEAAGMTPFGTDNVFRVEDEINAGRGQAINQDQGQPGDIVIVSDGPNRAHIGVCSNVGCTQVINNSSASARVENNGPPNMGYRTQPRFYHLNR